MKRFGAGVAFTRILAAAAMGLTLAATPALADNPGAIGPAEAPAKATFTKFAQAWMNKVQRLAAEQKPTVSPGASSTLVTYRDYTDEFTIELRPTGHAKAPFVGILRYNEQIFSCRNISTGDCSLSSQIPVTEIFRYQDGRWVY